jgi:hypothetical protein
LHTEDDGRRSVYGFVERRPFAGHTFGAVLIDFGLIAGVHRHAIRPARVFEGCGLQQQLRRAQREGGAAFLLLTTSTSKSAQSDTGESSSGRRQERKREVTNCMVESKV